MPGPPARRKTLVVTFSKVGCKRHPLAPCVALFYDDLGNKKVELSGLIVIDADDLFGILWEHFAIEMAIFLAERAIGKTLLPKKENEWWYMDEDMYSLLVLETQTGMVIAQGARHHVLKVQAEYDKYRRSNPGYWFVNC